MFYEERLKVVRAVKTGGVAGSRGFGRKTVIVAFVTLTFAREGGRFRSEPDENP